LIVDSSDAPGVEVTDLTRRLSMEGRPCASVRSLCCCSSAFATLMRRLFISPDSNACVGWEAVEDTETSLWFEKRLSGMKHF